MQLLHCNGEAIALQGQLWHSIVLLKVCIMVQLLHCSVGAAMLIEGFLRLSSPSMLFYTNWQIIIWWQIICFTPTGNRKVVITIGPIISKFWDRTICWYIFSYAQGLRLSISQYFSVFMHFHREKDCAKLINDQHQIKPALHETIFPSWIGWNNQSCAALNAPVQKKRG